MVATRAAFVTDDFSKVSERIGTIEFDCFVREKHTLSAQATEHAIEGTGQGRTDHVLQRPDMLVIEVVASNTPIRAPKTQAAGVRSMVGSKEVKVPAPLIPEVAGISVGLGPLDGFFQRTTTARVQVAEWSSDFDRRKDAWTELRRMKEAGQIITVVTSLQQYDSMVIEEIDTECTVKNGRALEATITLKSVALVDSKTVQAPGVPTASKSNGRQPSKEASSAVEDQASAAYRSFDAAGLLP